MPTLRLLRGNSISLGDALTDDDNILHRLDYPQKQEDFCEIESVVSFHLGVKHCQVADQAEWLCGSYNVCIPVYINLPSENCVLIRIPRPYKVGEENIPGNVDEKLRCEVATYIWIRENCPDVPIPTLYGFAFPNGQTFCDGRSNALQYLGRAPPGDKTRRQTLFGDIAKIMLSLDRVKLPRIGSLTLDDDGLIELKNRPLTLRLQTFENEDIPTIPRNSTYHSVEPYILDLLQLHDNRIHHQPNAIHNLNDG
ncbi:hypothetical protein N7517_006609 [Penicillium concentricum]|uniref:Aminoglycoside phosphotransferase domain-containing protein n=1 Tax=Penicillium concentricum TaxID=293559 RepID=A0A9W9VA61_9EURO|nr:uncharacterized protein N7517_006609 [Penicillium concentricum]KAJ5374603.1 hypothetical protein N7517_006609 [Penicillium concentricum]